MAILSFKDGETERIAQGFISRKYPADILTTARRKIRSIEAAVLLNDLASPPGNRLEALTGDRWGQHSIRINRQWRLCFRWEEGGAKDVEIVDYH